MYSVKQIASNTIILAYDHMNKGCQSKAGSCLVRAVEHFSENRFGTAFFYAKRSLFHSVGVLSPIYDEVASLNLKLR